MSNEALGKQHTLWEILGQYDQVQIPIIQRDYAQGRKDEKKVRDGILDHILRAAAGGDPVELDFVYGVEPDDKILNTGKKLFVPIDGQQRLTTLWLIHWYLALKAGLLDNPAESEVAKRLAKFAYEIRPSSNDFLQRLCDKKINKDCDDLRAEIVEEAHWFDQAWKLDPSITGFLTMLEAIADHKYVKGADPKELFDRLTNENAVTFYFLRLEKFGLGEEIYTRMNARGKILTDFETFKSNFFKIIDKSPLRADIADKIEYGWVTNLWPYRPKDAFVVDEPFLKWLRFVTQILYVRKHGAPKEEDNVDYISMEVLSDIYADEENLRFLVFSFDSIPALKDAPLEFSLKWDREKGLGKALEWILKEFNSTDVLFQLGVLSALLFLDRRKGDTKGMDDFMRVIRNLVGNTADNGLRQWPVIIDSIKTLIGPDIYAAMRSKEVSFRGFRSEQTRIEQFKARLIEAQPDALPLIRRMDANPSLKGRLENIIIESLEPRATSKFTLELKDIKPEEVNLKALGKLYEAYKAIRKYNDESQDFLGMWADLIPTRFYKVNESYCWWDDEADNYADYAVHPVLLKLVRQVAGNNGDVDKTLSGIQKKYVCKMLEKYEGDLSAVNQPKEQLYLLYIMSVRLCEQYWWDFFRNDNRLNFSWVPAESGFSNPFDAQLNGDGLRRPIYQSYSQRFVSYEIIERRTPSILKANVRGKNIFARLAEWAQS